MTTPNDADRDFGSSDCSSAWRNLWLVFRFDGKDNTNRTLIDGVVGGTELEALEEAKDRNPRKPDDIILVKRCASETEYDWMREAWGNRNNAVEEIRKMIEG